MSIPRIQSWLLAGILALVTGASAFAQLSFPPLTPFAAFDGTQRQAGEGFFFGASGLVWQIEAPNVTTVGKEGLTRLVIAGGGVIGVPFNQLAPFRVESNTLDTSFADAEFRGGQQFEFGYIEDGHGWHFRTWQLNGNSNRLNTSNVDVVFNDPPAGPFGLENLVGFVDLVTNGTALGPPDGMDDDLDGDTIAGRTGLTTDLDDLARLPVRFTLFETRIRNEMWSIEAMKLVRLKPFHGGGVLELFFGTRYMEFDEEFSFFGGADDANPVAFDQVLSDTTVKTDAENNIVGPVVGARFRKMLGRASVSAEGQFFSGYNFQNIRQEGRLGSNLMGGGLPNTPLNLDPTQFTHVLHEEEFSPMVEVRIEGSVNLTRAIAVNVGWAGFWVDAIARPSVMVDYSLPSMGLLRSANQQDMFVHGLFFGFVVNK